MLPELYVLTNSQRFSHSEWPDRVEQAIRGGATIIQLRDKHLSDDQLHPHASLVQEVCKSYNVPLIINDRVLLAKRIRADGVHLGKQDQHIRTARQTLGNHFMIGVSCYKNLFTAIQSQKLGADYVAFGSVYPSLTKQQATRCSLAVIRKAEKILSVPVCAIGGINHCNIAPVAKAGAAIIAVSHAVFNAENPQVAATTIARQAII